MVFHEEVFQKVDFKKVRRQQYHAILPSSQSYIYKCSYQVGQEVDVFLFASFFCCCFYFKFFGCYKYQNQVLAYLHLFELNFNVTVNNFSVMFGWVFLGWISMKQHMKCLTQGLNTGTPPAVGLRLATLPSPVLQLTKWANALHFHLLICVEQNQRSIPSSPWVMFNHFKANGIFRKV